jgi:hypothetical protein
VPKKKFKSKKAFFINIFLIYALCVAATVFWYSKSGMNYFEYIRVAMLDLGREMKDLYFSTVGLYFGKGYDFLSPFIIIVYSAVMLVVALSDVRYKPFAKNGIVLFLVALVSVMLILAMTDFINTIGSASEEAYTAGMHIKDGFGIPILFSLLLIFNIRAVKVDMSVVNGFVLPFTAFMEMLAIYSVVSRIA